MESSPLVTRHGATPYRWLLRYLAGRGLSAEAIARGLSLAPAVMYPESGAMPTERLLRILNFAARELDDPRLGVDLAERISTNEMGLVGHLILNVATLRQSFEFLQRYHRIFSPDYDFRFTYSDREVRGVYVPADIPGADCTEDIDFGMALVVRACREVAGNSWQPRRCGFSYAEPACLAVHRDWFGSEVLFNQPDNFIEFDSAILDMPNDRADPSLLPILLYQANQLIDELDIRENIVRQVRLLITTSLGYSTVTTGTVAHSLNMSVRQLHRKLGEHNTSFQKIKDETVLKVAREALAESELSITQIALKLGYSETSAFDRAFKKLAGTTPRQYRNAYSG